MARAFATVAIPFASSYPTRSATLLGRAMGWFFGCNEAKQQTSDSDLDFRVTQVESQLREAGQDLFDYLRLGAEGPADPRHAVGRNLDETGIIHFMSIHVHRGQRKRGGRSERPCLLIEVTADGSFKQALHAVAAALDKTLAAVIGQVDPRYSAQQSDAVARQLIRHHRAIGQGWLTPALGLVFDGSPGMTVKRLRAEAALAAHIAELTVLSDPYMTAHEKLRKVRDRLWQDDANKWASLPEPTPILDPPPDPTATGILSLQQCLGLLPSAAIQLFWPLAVPVLALWTAFGWLFGSQGYLVAAVLGLLATSFCMMIGVAGVTRCAKRHLNQLEIADRPRDRTPDPAKIGGMMRTEGVYSQGLLASVSVMKPGWFNSGFRRLTLRLAFWSIRAINAREVRPGFLGPIADIHFARWFFLPGSDKLFFWSNYDGSWASYIEDFIQLGHEGVSAIWSNTRDFPRTFNLIQGGASDGDRLRRWARQQMYAPEFWYSAYPRLTLRQIRRNAAIRQGIACARTQAEAENWLDLFGSAPPPPATVPDPQTAPLIPSPAIMSSPVIVPAPVRLEKHEIPTLVFGGRRHLRYGTCIVVTMSDSRDECKTWLKAIEPLITYGDERHTAVALSFALSGTGFNKLGYPQDVIDFPPVFRNGMTAPWRSVALGDTGDDAPDRWKWADQAPPPKNPGERPQADAILLIYADTETRLRDQIARLNGLAKGHNHAPIDLAPLPPRSYPVREPFGFIDGISQPILRDGPAPRDPIHGTEPGEFILGYIDNSGYYPSTPTVSAAEDPGNRLVECVGYRESGQPIFGQGGSNGRHDLGRNGTFLVIRQLEQDVEGFDTWLASAADKADPLLRHLAQDAATRRELIAAKLMGRDRVTGSSLLRQPNAPVLDNDFLPGQQDPQGLRCPFGAHIRRANPRDSLNTTDPESALSIANRHRIIRRSRTYVDHKGKPKGTLFMCLNADIERQFEFLQQTYLRARDFEGLKNEVDPIVGRRADVAPDKATSFTIPTSKGPARLRGLPEFVHVRGGGYFFMPARRTVTFLAHPSPSSHKR